MPKILRKIGGHASEVRREVLKQILTLSTSGFGLVAALAWNELIKEVVTEYIKPVAGENSGIISLLIYAIVVTFLAVLITYNLSKIAKKN